MQVDELLPFLRRNQEALIQEVRKKDISLTQFAG